MTRIKKYIRDKGVKLSADYDCIPYQISGHFMSPGNISLLDVIIDVEKAMIYEVLNIGTTVYQVNRNGTIEIVDFV